MTVALENEVIGGELLGAHVVPIRSYAADRVCAREGCTTRLSVYNGSDRCAAHDFHVDVVDAPAPPNQRRLAPPRGGQGRLNPWSRSATSAEGTVCGLARRLLSDVGAKGCSRGLLGQGSAGAERGGMRRQKTGDRRLGLGQRALGGNLASHQHHHPIGYRQGTVKMLLDH